MPLVNQLDNLFETAIRNALNQALSPDLPVVGGALAQLANGFAFQQIRDAVADALNGAGNPSSPAAIAAAINGSPLAPQISASVSGANVLIDITASETETVDLDGVGLSTGGSVVGLNASADLGGSLSAALDLQLLYNPAADSLTLVDKAGDEIVLEAGIAADIAAGATMGPLSLAITDNVAGNEAELRLGVNMADLTPAGVSVQRSGNAMVGLSMVASAGTDLIPSIDADMNISWDLTNPTAAPSIAFDDVGVDLGSLIDIIAEALEPLLDILFDGVVGKIVNGLTEPLPILDEGLHAIGLTSIFDQIPEGGDDILNMLDLIGGYFKSEKEEAAYQALSVTAEALAVLKQLNLVATTGKIPLGSFTVGSDGTPGAFNVASVNGKQPLELVADLLESSNVLEQALDEVKGLSKGGSGAFSDYDLTDETGLRLPLLENPERIIDVLLPGLTGGGPVPLIEYDIPALAAQVGFGPYFFSIIGPIGVTVRGELGATTDFRIGYDTTALLGNGTFLDGLYVGVDELEPGTRLPDQEPNYVFEHEPFMWGNSSVNAGVGVNLVVAKAAVEGGVAGSMGAFLPNSIDIPSDSSIQDDYDPTGLTDTARLTDMFGGGCAFDPILGRLAAEIVATFSINFFFFSYSWEVTIAEVTIVDFNFGCDPEIDPINGLASALGNTVLQLHVGELPAFGAQFRVINGQPTNDPVYQTEHYQIGIARDADGVAIPGALAVQWNDMRQDFTLDDDAVIIGFFGSKNDSIVLEAEVTQSLNVSGGDGLDVLIGALGDDELHGDEGNDRLFGNEGDDVLMGGEGNDLLEGGAGADILDGGAGQDKVSYENSDAAVIMEWIGQDGLNAIYGVTGGEAEGDTLISIEQIIGSRFGDQLYGSALADNALEGRAGNDVLVGGLLNDLLMGGEGADLLEGRGGMNGTSYLSSWGGVRIDMEDGRGHGGDAEGDQLYNIQLIQGSAFYDILRGTDDDDMFSGYDGEDILEGRGGQDEIEAGGGNDTVIALGDGDTLDGGDGRDLLSYRQAAGPVFVDLIGGVGSLQGLPPFDDIKRVIFDVDGEGGVPGFVTNYSTFEDLLGSDFNDVLTGDDGRNMIDGGEGNDTIDGGAGDDTLIGGFGADNLQGGLGRDLADYSAGFSVDVSLDGAVGSGDVAQGDVLNGIEDLRGTRGVDTLTGNSDDNRIEIGLSRGGRHDLASGGRTSAGADIADGGAGNDTLIVDWSVSDYGGGMSGGFTGAGSGAFVRMTGDGTAALDQVQFSNFERLFVTGTLQNDTITGGSGNDRIYSGAGDDTIDAGGGSDLVLADDGDDRVTWRADLRSIDGTALTALPLMYLDGGAGIDALSLDLSLAEEDIVISGFATASEFEGINLLTSSGGVVRRFERLDQIWTGAGDDWISQGGVVDNFFSAGRGQDRLTPGLGVDFVDGGGDFGARDSNVFVDPGIEDVVQFSSYADILSNAGDLLELDYSDLSGGVVGETTPVQTGFVANDPYFTNGGTYVGPAGEADLTFENIERINAIGSAYADRLTGTYDGFTVLRFNRGLDAAPDEVLRGDDRLDGGAGDDTLLGYTGDDVLIGGEGNDILIGGYITGHQGAIGAGEVPSFLDRVGHGDEIDTLEGGAGADTFVLGAVLNFPSGSRAETYYEGEGYARIVDFSATEGDKLQLAGSAADYQVVNSPINDDVSLFRIENQSTGLLNLIAIVEGVGTLDLNASYIDYVDPSNPGVPISGALVAPIFAPIIAPLQGGLDPIAKTLAAPEAAQDDTPDTGAATLASDEAPGWVTQENDPAALIAALFAGGSDGIDHSKDQLELIGDGRAFGVFSDDPFGLGSGVVMSTGKVEDIDETNRIDGGWTGVSTTDLVFEEIGLNGGTTIYRADLTNLGFDLNSLTITDADTRDGGSPGAASGFDLDAIALSRTRIDNVAGLDLNDAATLPRLDLFDFSAAGITLSAGSRRSTGNAFLATNELYGTSNGLVDQSAATLDRFDGSGNLADATGMVTLGDGGSIRFDLTDTARTNMPLYLYVGEYGDPETLISNVEVAERGPTTPADLSTDFGAAGAEDDAISMTYRFETLPEFSGGMATFDYVFFSEELIEWAGSEFNDMVRITLNGVQLAQLSDGGALSINTLRPAPVAASHPDFVWNPAVDGPIPQGPVADNFRGDGYTQTLNFAGAVQAGQNELKIEIMDVRDGFMDSGVLIKGGSFQIVDEHPAEVDYAASGTTLIEGGPAVAIPITLSRDPTAPVTFTFTPNEDVDLGSGAGAEHMVTLNPGDPLSFSLQARAVQDFVTEGAEFVVAGVTVASGDADFDGLNAPGLLFTIEEKTGAGQRVDVAIGDAPERFSRTDPDAWSDAWSDPRLSLSWTEDATAPVWSAVNLGTAQPGNFGGSGLSRGDLGVSGVSRPSEILPQEIDGQEALRVGFEGFRADTAIVRLANFTTDDGAPGAHEAARFSFFDDSETLLAQRVVSADQGLDHMFSGFAGAAFMIVEAGAEIGGVFTHGALTGRLPEDDLASGFMIDSFLFSGEEIL